MIDVSHFLQKTQIFVPEKSILVYNTLVGYTIRMNHAMLYPPDFNR